MRTLIVDKNKSRHLLSAQQQPRQNSQLANLFPAAEHSYRGLVNRSFLCLSIHNFEANPCVRVGIDVSLNGITRISSRRIVHNRPEFVSTFRSPVLHRDPFEPEISLTVLSPVPPKGHLDIWRLKALKLAEKRTFVSLPYRLFTTA